MNQSSPLSQPERHRLDEQIAASIADAILNGVFPAGSTLPPERDLAEQLGVNRTSLRQALARLQHMGLIEARHGSGTVVRDPDGLTHPAVVEALVRKLGPEFLIELLEVRSAFGAMIGRLAAQRGSDADAETLSAALASVRQAATAEARQETELAFFRVLVHATGNRALGLLYRWVEDAFGGREHALTAAYDDGLIEAFNTGEDLHSFVAARAFGVPIDEVTPELRRRVKAMSYGLAYGLSAYGLSQQLKISTEEANEQMDAYFARFGGVRDYLHAVVDRARKDGYTSTVLGRRRYLPELDSSNRQVRESAERAALNAPIQGSAADIIKVAMIEVDKALRDGGLRSRMLLQVHDELMFEVAEGERDPLEALVRDRMGGAYPLDVPLEVSVGYGRSWDAAAH